MDTPILFLFYKRPGTASRVFEQIRKARPKQLFLACDGPRRDVRGEGKLCIKSRQTIESMLDWDCDVRRLYRQENLGCKEAVSSAIRWFFDHVREGIILEDDTLPSHSFFRFAEEMLDRYRNDGRVMHISGNNYQHRRIRGDGSYYGSQFAHSWGWATWADAWARYDQDLTHFNDGWDMLANALGFSDRRKEWWRQSLSLTRDGKIGTWDFQWHYSIMKSRGLCILPQVNLVENIGVGAGATHFRRETNSTRTRAGEMEDFLAPSTLLIEQEWDEFDFRHSVLNEKYPVLSPTEKEKWRQFSSLHRVITRPEGIIGKVFFRL